MAQNRTGVATALPLRPRCCRRAAKPTAAPIRHGVVELRPAPFFGPFAAFYYS